MTGTVTILAGDTTATIDVSGIVDDNLLEGNETVDVTLTAITAGDSDIALDSNAANLTDTVTISDNDAATVSISANDDAASESATDNGQFSVL